LLGVQIASAQTYMARAVCLGAADAEKTGKGDLDGEQSERF